jgi:hypothetical protein
MNIRKVMIGWLAVGALTSVLLLANEAAGILTASQGQDLSSHVSVKAIDTTASVHGSQGSASCFYPVSRLEIQRGDDGTLTAWWPNGRIVSYDPKAQTLTTWDDPCSDVIDVQTGVDAFGEEDFS